MNTIVIQKETNGNVTVIHASGREYKLDPGLAAFKEVQKGVCVLRSVEGREREVLDPVDVEKVIRADTSEVLINDLDTLFTELNQNFFFDAIAANVGIGWTGQVTTRNDLPTDVANPLVGAVYLVEQPVSVTVLGIPYRTFQSGFYIRDTANGNLNDWRRLNVKVQFTGAEFAIVNSLDTGAQFGFDPSRVTSGNKRIFTAPDRDALMVAIQNGLLIPGNANKRYDIQLNGAGDDYDFFETFEDQLVSSQGLINQGAGPEIFLDLVTTIPVAGIYEFESSWQWSFDTLVADFAAGVLINGAVPANGIFFERAVANTGAGIVLPTISGGVIGPVANTNTNIVQSTYFKTAQAVAAGPMSFQLLWLGLSPGNPAAMRHAYLKIKRVG